MTASFSICSCPTTLTNGRDKHWPSHLSLLRPLSSVTRAIIAILYIWSETLSGFATFLYTHPVRGTLCARVTESHNQCGLEKAADIIESNLWADTTVSTRPWHCEG